MKKILTLSAAILLLMTIASCKKQVGPVKTTDGSRSVKFKLYTNEDFSNDDHNITFSIFIKDGDLHLFDSTYATIKIKDIPKIGNAIIAEKRIYNNNHLLTAGFVYEIQNIGVSWHIDTLSAGTKSKVIEYPFR